MLERSCLRQSDPTEPQLGPTLFQLFCKSFEVRGGLDRHSRISCNLSTTEPRRETAEPSSFHVRPCAMFSLRPMKVSKLSHLSIFLSSLPLQPTNWLYYTHLTCSSKAPQASFTFSLLQGCDRRSSLSGLLDSEPVRHGARAPKTLAPIRPRA